MKKLLFSLALLLTAITGVFAAEAKQNVLVTESTQVFEVTEQVADSSDGEIKVGDIDIKKLSLLQIIRELEEKVLIICDNF